MKAKKFLQEELKHHNFDGIIHYGSHGEKSIDVAELLQKFARQCVHKALEEAAEKVNTQTRHPAFSQSYIVGYSDCKAESYDTILSLKAKY